jgi:hypothetical protein
MADEPSVITAAVILMTCSVITNYSRLTRATKSVKRLYLIKVRRKERLKEAQNEIYKK